MWEIAQRKCIFECQLLAGEKLCGRTPKLKDIETIDPDYVRSHLRDLLLNSGIQAANHRRDGNHCHHADDNSKHSEPGAQLILGNGVHRHVDRLKMVFLQHA